MNIVKNKKATNITINSETTEILFSNLNSFYPDIKQSKKCCQQ